MTDFVVYESTTGEIIRIGSCPTDFVASQAIVANESVVEGQADLLLDYVLAGVITPRPSSGITINKTNFTADSVDTVTLSAIPANAVYSLSGPNDLTDSLTVSDGVLNIQSDYIGDHVITIEAFPDMPYNQTITGA